MPLQTPVKPNTDIEYNLYIWVPEGRVGLPQELSCLDRAPYSSKAKAIEAAKRALELGASRVSVIEKLVEITCVSIFY